MNENPTHSNITFLEGVVVNQILCMTTKPIQSGDELFGNYGSDVDRQNWVHHRTKSASENHMAFVEYETEPVFDPNRTSLDSALCTKKCM